MTVKIEFWSDTLPDGIIPKRTFRNLRPDTVRSMMRKVLELFDGANGDLWAVRQDIDRNKWEEKRFVFVKDSGAVSEEAIEDE